MARVAIRSRAIKGHARSTSGGFEQCIFFSYNGIGALYGNNLIPWLLLLTCIKTNHIIAQNLVDQRSLSVTSYY